MIFSLPFKELGKQLNSVWNQGEEGQYTICALALCVIFDNRLEVKYLESKEPGLRAVLDDVCEACGLCRGASTVKILEKMNTLVDTYFEEAKGIYTTVHDKCRNLYIWTNFPEENDGDQDDFIILIPDSKLTLYLNRLVMEWSHGKIKDVFLENNNMNNEIFREQLLIHLRQLDTAKQTALALMQVGYAELRFSCLEMCCAKGYTDLLPWILEKGVDINQCIGGTTPLTFACKENNTEVITEILQLKVDINKTGRATPLHWMCLVNDIEIIRLLLRNNADINIRQENGSTPLFLACLVSSTKVVRLLLNHGADQNIRTNTRKRPLDIARENNHSKIVSLLEGQRGSLKELQIG
ncbi:unnamed protein product [Mytilus edulis]|uniref:Uncharacterized protein n=1 Tax=Mytilus edulis TaxID=6550 RepID=A0A8S3U5T3_MYTED|nr:unnamed protein product [Mytilus edulis]